ncbi:MAG TPA: hypothetical protein VK454_13185 [Myxococcaceae bacterium]|nr:hypothetical protein [Myxococcaceae bacterium]
MTMRRMVWALGALALLVVGALPGCKPSLPPTQITDAGLGFEIQDSIFIDFGPPDYLIGMLLSDHTGLCDLLNAGVGLDNLKNTNSLALSFLDAVGSSTAAPVTPGVYQVTVSFLSLPSFGKWSEVYEYSSDETCEAVNPPLGVDGTVTLNSIDRVDGGHAVGSYDVVFTTAQRVQGPFDATWCNYTFVLDGGTGDGGVADGGTNDGGFDAGTCY